MRIVGRVESLWRYPVKSMRGERQTSLQLDSRGVAGDRLYAFRYSKARDSFPYLTAREVPEMLLYQATWRNEHVEVTTPDGSVLPVEDSQLETRLRHRIPPEERIWLLTSERPMTDCQPVSLLSLQSTRQLGVELHLDMNKMRFRANVYLDLESGIAFEEDSYTGRKLRIGLEAVVEVIERDPRCKIITLDPDTATAAPDVFRQVAESHEKCFGVYASVLTPGAIAEGDSVVLLD